MLKNSMMDKIKIRAYDLVENRMRCDIGALEFNTPENTISWVAFNFDFDQLIDDRSYHQNSNQKLEFYDANCADIMFSTMHKDIEGNEIYECDIIKSQYGTDGPVKYFIVEIDEFIGGFKPMSLTEVGYNSDLCWVVGNTYENKELLDKVTYL